jgi:hypothetical protein
MKFGRKVLARKRVAARKPLKRFAGFYRAWSTGLKPRVNESKSIAFRHTPGETASSMRNVAPMHAPENDFLKTVKD